MLKRLFSRAIETEVEKRLKAAVRARDDKRDLLYTSSTYPRDRRGYDRDEMLADALEAWRVNPLARRIVAMMTQYVVGGGITIESKHNKTNKFLAEWWNHPLNRMTTRIYEWCDELTRSGELFIVVSTDQAGMSYLRAIPAANIQDIETADNDLEQELFIVEKPSVADQRITASTRFVEARRWKVYSREEDSPDETGKFEPVMLHYAINRPVGAKFGESDLAPVLRWLTRYAGWLEDRARLNRYRNTFLFWVKARFTNNAERLERQAELNRNPPNPGAILVTDESETWEVLSPKLEAHQAGEDGLALKKMVALGAGLPMHFLSEPEGATRTTAEASGGPTFRHFQQRQEFFLWMLSDLAGVAVRRRKFFDRGVNPLADIQVNGTDISARDNASLATAASTAIGAFGNLRDRGLIDDAELLRIAYRFAGEAVDLEDLLNRGAAAPSIYPLPERKGGMPGRPAGVKIDPLTGDPVEGGEPPPEL